VESLRQQIDPYLTAQPSPDQTFREYIEELLKQPLKAPSEFSSAFTGAGEQATQSSGGIGVGSPTTSVTEGLFSQYLTNEGGGSDNGGGTTVGGSSSGRGAVDSFAGANTVIGLDQAAALAGTMAGKQGIAEVVGLLTGSPIASIVAGQLASPVLGFMGNQAFDSFNKGVDFSSQSFNDASMLGGLGTFSNAAGHVGTFSNQGLIDAYDMANFGITSGGMNAGDYGGYVGPTGGLAESFDGSPSAPSANVGAQEGFDGSPGGGDSGSSKIVCTAMNHAYGFGSFRQAVWLQYSKDNLSKAHEVGYHTMFLPLVDIAYKKDKWYSKPIRKTLEHIARHRTADLRAEMRNTKRDTLGRAYRFVLEPLCYIVGKVKGY
jgi:hypothetical protein